MGNTPSIEPTIPGYYCSMQVEKLSATPYNRWRIRIRDRAPFARGYRIRTTSEIIRNTNHAGLIQSGMGRIGNQSVNVFVAQAEDGYILDYFPRLAGTLETEIFVRPPPILAPDWRPRLARVPCR